MSTFLGPRRLILVVTGLLAFLPVALAQTGVPPYVFSSLLLQLIANLPEGGWAKVNTNHYSDVWTPSDLIPLAGPAPASPELIILPWSGFAWDSNRGDLILYGGGHGNYSGNDVYRWHSSSLQWERASLPSEIVFLPGAGPPTMAIDGADAAPASAHTYTNSIFLPIADRFLAWGGALYNSGGPYVKPSESDPTQLRQTGPYLFDPAKADANKVGGTTGSHVQRVAPHPEIVGGNMWENRDIYKNLAGSSLPWGNGGGCAAYAQENNHDVVYLGAPTESYLQLYRYELVDLAFPVLDRISHVGMSFSGGSPCGYDPAKKLFVRTGGNTVPFLFWDLLVPSPANQGQRVDVMGSLVNFQNWLSSTGTDLVVCGMVFDPVRERHMIWCGTGVVWALTSPSANVTYGWTIAQQPVPTTVTPPGDIGTGMFGKWKYIPYFDVFMGLMDPVNGDIWVYKPLGWQSPVPPPLSPTGVLASDGTSATSVTVSWTASTNATSYTVYRSTTGGQLGTSIGSTSTTSLTDTTVTPGVTYYYSVTATGVGGTSAASAQNSGFAAASSPTITNFSALATAAGRAASQTVASTPPPSANASLAGSSTVSSATVNITQAGSTDWAKWPNYVHKATGGSQIYAVVTVGPVALQSYGNDARTLTWSDGTPTASGSDQAGLFVSGVGSGFLITAPADTTSRTLNVYVGGSNSSGLLIAHLSDGSALDYVTNTTPVTGQYDLVYTVTYRAASNGQQLSVNWSQVSGSGNVTLQGAALK